MAIKKNITALLVATLMIYEIWYIEDFGAVPMLLQVLTVLIFLSTLWMTGGTLEFCFSLNCWLLFGCTAFLTGIFVTTSISALASSIVTYFSFLLVCILIYNLCIVFRSTQWIINIVLIANILCAVSVILFGEEYKNGVYVVTMGAENNPNYLGISMLYGIFACFTRIDTKKWKKTIGYTLLITAFSYVIVLSGSRSTLIGLVLVIFVCFVFGVNLKSLTSKIEIRHLVYFAGAIFAIAVIGNYISNTFINSAAMDRLLLLTQGGAQGRTDLYVKAVELFLESPIVGIGYNNFAIASGYGYFSHSTYAETLACTGVIGCVLWFVPYLRSAKGLLKSRKLHMIGNNKWISLYVVLLFMGIFGIVYYTLQSLIMFTILFAQLRIWGGIGKYDNKY